MVHKVTSEDSQQEIKDSVVSCKKLQETSIFSHFCSSWIFHVTIHPAKHGTNTQGTQTIVEELTEQLQVDEEVSLAAEKLSLLLKMEKMIINQKNLVTPAHGLKSQP